MYFWGNVNTILPFFRWPAVQFYFISFHTLVVIPFATCRQVWHSTVSWFLSTKFPRWVLRSTCQRIHYDYQILYVSVRTAYFYRLNSSNVCAVIILNLTAKRSTKILRNRFSGAHIRSFLVFQFIPVQTTATYRNKNMLFARIFPTF